jgi:molecular chaperone GrpE
LPVLDNFHASTDHVPEDQKDGAWVTGIMHIQKQLEDTLKELGAEEISVQIGDELDPEKHEAIEDTERGVQDEDDKNRQDDGKIEKIVQKGYMFGGRVIRPARVIVS